MDIINIPQAPIITKLAFRFKFTNEEYVAILTAAKTDVEVQAWVETFNMATMIDLSNQYTKDGLQLLVTKGLLTLERSEKILEHNPL